MDWIDKTIKEKEKDDEARCRNCIFFIEKTSEEGYCYYHPPTILPDGSQRRPSVSQDAFCAYYTTKEEFDMVKGGPIFFLPEEDEDNPKGDMV